MSTFDEINQRFAQVLNEIGGADTERSITKIIIQVGAFTASRIPIATSTLINSQYRYVRPTANGWRGGYGFGANYAAFVHNAPGTLLGTETPRYPKSDGVVWGPNGEPGFLAKGVDEVTPMLSGILRGEYSK